MKLALIQRLNQAKANRQAAILCTRLDGDNRSSQQRLILEEDDLSTDPLASDLKSRFLSGKSGLIQSPTGENWFLNVALPPPRLVIIGAVHISQALLPMAQIANFDVAIIDPRAGFANNQRFPADVLRQQWPQDALAEPLLDPHTALVAVTHDPKIDDFPLHAALTANCFYVGALGSRKTHISRVERLQAAGLSDELISRIHAPIGLNIGAASPAEIAVAILAQIIDRLRRAP